MIDGIVSRHREVRQIETRHEILGPKVEWRPLCCHGKAWGGRVWDDFKLTFGTGVGGGH